MVEDLHGSFTNKLRIGFQEAFGDDVVLVEHLQRVCQANAVHVELVANVDCNIFQMSAL